MKEMSRQLGHFFGLVFVLFALIIDKTIIMIYFFMIAFSMLFYSFYITKQQNKLVRVFEKLEAGFKNLVNKFERETTKMPFIGAFWFYFSCGLVLLLFPLNIAIVSCAILAVADSVSTLVGINFGKHRIIGNKSIEGSLSFFISAFFVAFLFINIWVAFFAAGIATLAEILPDVKPLRKLKEKEILDDNFTVPMITGLFLFVIL